MAIQKGIYNYPVKSVSEAKIVIEPEFQPDLFDEHKLYVNLDDIRDKTYLNDLYFDLGYVAGKGTFDTPTDYTKIIFSGHRGCGKSAELRRINKELNHAERYFPIFIDLEQEVEVGSFQYADFFSLLIYKLIEELSKKGIKKGASNLNKLAEKLFQTEEVERKGKTRSSSTGEAGADVGFKLFGSGGKVSFKELFSSENETSRIVRQRIKQNTLKLINELNVEMVDVRANVEAAGKGLDVLFIIDGSEKIQSEVYEELFIKNGSIISEISVNMLIAVPITAHYLIEKAPYKFTNRYTVPMLKLSNANVVQKMKEIVGKRLDLDTFIEEDALEQCIFYSGGCIRQLFQVMHTSLKKSLGQKIKAEHVQKALLELGKYLWEYLDNDHLDVIKKGNYRPADAKVGELLYMLILLKYNGVIEINPLLKNYPDFKTWLSQ
jgi:hypothetical protein